MKLSHSKLSCILNCPMTYYLTYKEGIDLKEGAPALAIGSAVHWGIEHNTEDLSEHYKEEGNFKQADAYGHDELLAESMVHGYMKKKDELFAELLKDEETGEQLDLLDEQHEIEIYADLPSKKFDEPHVFHGIIDLLLLTEKGFILIDYKTSSKTPDWDKYLDQIYRYIFLLKQEFPTVPVYKIGIINIKKSMIRQKQGENEDSFLIRLKKEYDTNSDLICSHIYKPWEMDQKLIDDYIDNLSSAADMAQLIDDNEAWYINYNNAVTEYGKSKFWDIFYDTKDCYLLYKIKDTIWDEDEGLLTSRDCVPIDMATIHNKNVLNHFDKFNEVVERIYSANDRNNTTATKDSINKTLMNTFIVDEDLLEKYWRTREYVISQENAGKPVDKA